VINHPRQFKFEGLFSPKETLKIIFAVATCGQQEMLVSIARLQNQHLPKLFVFLGTLT
jgi:hypothetical protein